MKRILLLCFMVALLFAQQSSIKEGINSMTGGIQAMLAFMFFLLLIPMGLIVLAGAAVYFTAKSEKNRKIGKFAAMGGMVITVILLLLYLLVPAVIGAMLPTP
ncbi:MAG: hypothetical protein NTY83_01375 [Candidatus Micrarchaeota archaeon]|nr:hypothetical protein [Candidatus Micrarchaeota archaeon]